MGKEEEGRDAHGYGICPPEQLLTCADALLSRWSLIVCLLMGSSDRIPLFVLLVRTAFAFSVKLVLSQSTSLLAFLLLSPHSAKEVNERAAG